MGQERGASSRRASTELLPTEVSVAACGRGWVGQGSSVDISHRCLFLVSARSAVSIACQGHGSPSSDVSGARQAAARHWDHGGTVRRQVGLLQGRGGKELVEISTASGPGQLQGRGQVQGHGHGQGPGQVHAPQPFPGSAQAWAGGLRAPPTQHQAAVLFLKRVLVVCCGDNGVLLVLVVLVVVSVSFPRSPALAGRGCAAREHAGQGRAASPRLPFPVLCHSYRCSFLPGRGEKCLFNYLAPMLGFSPSAELVQNSKKKKEKKAAAVIWMLC